MNYRSETVCLTLAGPCESRIRVGVPTPRWSVGCEDSVDRSLEVLLHCWLGRSEVAALACIPVEAENINNFSLDKPLRFPL